MVGHLRPSGLTAAAFEAGPDSTDGKGASAGLTGWRRPALAHGDRLAVLDGACGPAAELVDVAGLAVVGCRRRPFLAVCASAERLPPPAEHRHPVWVCPSSAKKRSPTSRIISWLWALRDSGRFSHTRSVSPSGSSSIVSNEGSSNDNKLMPPILADSALRRLRSNPHSACSGRGGTQNSHRVPLAFAILRSSVTSGQPSDSASATYHAS